jgi:methyl-accepting chemotaxis protein
MLTITKKRGLSENMLQNLSIRMKWIIFICGSIFLAVGITALVNYSISYHFLKSNIEASNVSDVQNTSNQVKLQLDKYRVSAEQLATLTEQQVATGNKKNIEKMIHQIQMSNKDYISTYFMDFDTGKLSISPAGEPGAYDNFNTLDTTTYSKLTANPSTQWVDVYEDKTTKKIMTSIIVPVFKHDKLVGAVGYDIDLSTIGNIRADLEKNNDTKYVFLDTQGLVVTGYDDKMAGTNINPTMSGKVEGVSDYIDQADTFKTEYSWVPTLYKKADLANESLTIHDQDYMVSSATVGDTGWKVVSFVNKGKISDAMQLLNIAAIAILIVMLLFGIVVALMFAKGIRKIFFNLQHAFQTTASGDLGHEMDATRKDEIGMLASHYNDMLRNMRRLIHQVNEHKDEIHTATDGLSQITEENRRAVTAVSQAVNEISVGATSQSQEIERGTQSVYELSNEIDVLRAESEAGQKSLAKTMGDLQDSNETVHQLTQSFTKFEAAFEQVETMMTTLNEKSKSISQVTRAISDITDQTNLLALNASIEAARAGEHGKGFAVVADEVRKLAESSKAATNDIQNILSEVLDGMQELVETISDTNTLNEAQRQSVATVEAAMTRLTSALTTITAGLKKNSVSVKTINNQKQIVVEMMEELSAVSEQTTASTQQIAAVMNEQSSATSKVAEHAKHLKEEVNALNDAVDVFKLRQP